MPNSNSEKHETPTPSPSGNPNNGNNGNSGSNGNAGNGNPNNGNNGNSGSNGNSGGSTPPEDICPPIQNSDNNRIEFFDGCRFFSIDVNLIPIVSIYCSETQCHTLVISMEFLHGKTYKFYTNKKNKKFQNAGGSIFLDNITFKHLVSSMNLNYSDFSVID